MTSVAERTLRNLFKRCVLCPTGVPSCPSCPAGEICVLHPPTCDSCSYNTCMPNPAAAPAAKSHTNSGAIAGGVIGGVALVLIIVFLRWRFYIKKKRAMQDLEWRDVDDIAAAKSGNQFNGADAASTRTRASLAASIRSRASNFISIAYIPGVTTRGGSGHNSILNNNIPVPPIPAAYANPPPKTPLINANDALFFTAADLRGSTYSDNSYRSGRRDTRLTQHSISPSLASDIYHDDASMDPMPATTITRAAARVVSVKSANTNSPTDSSASSNTPKLLFPSQSNTRPDAPRSLSGGSLSFVKANSINVKPKGRFPIRQASDASSTATSSRYQPSVSSPLIEASDASESEEDEHARARQSLLKGSGSPTSTAASTPIMQPSEDPFFDASELPLSNTPPPLIPTGRANAYSNMSASVSSPGLDRRRSRRASNGRSLGGLSAVIEEATKRRSLGAKDDVANPFSDLHST